MKMHAAVVTSFDQPPHYQEFDIPQPANDDEMIVDVLAAGLLRECEAALVVLTTAAPERCP
jgi:D-arabinose 1-dehydrogenase-like Zn-dependent alcohol dehydrogenase